MSDLVRELEALDAKATKGPWMAVTSTISSWDGKKYEDTVLEPLELYDSESGDSLLERGDAEAMAALRSCLPALIEYVKAADNAREWIVSSDEGARSLAAHDLDAHRLALLAALRGGK